MGIRRNSKTVIVAAVTSLVIAGGIGAYAAIPAADGTITACYDPANPNVRLLDTATASACPTGQQKISWNQKGLKGDGFRYVGGYDVAKDRANGYEVGDVVNMYDKCSNTDWRVGDSGTYVKVTKQPFTDPDNWQPCVAPKYDGTARAGWRIMSRNGARGPTGYQGAPGAPGPTYFARIGANDSDTNRSTWRTTIKTWNYGDVVWINMPNIDVTKCAVSPTPISSTVSAHVLRSDVSYKDWILLRTFLNGVPSRMAVDVTIACSESDDPSTPNS